MNLQCCFIYFYRFDCDCTVGYTGSRCEMLADECQSNPCQHGGTCRNLVGRYECSCLPGFTGKIRLGLLPLLKINAKKIKIHLNKGPQ